MSFRKSFRRCFIQDIYIRGKIITEKMVKCIDQNGVDYRDDRGIILLYRCVDMTDEQLDIYFSYNPNLFDVYSYIQSGIRGIPYLPLHSLLDGKCIVNVINRFINHDVQNRYVYEFRDEITASIDRILKMTDIDEFKETLKHVKTLFGNKEKKVMSFFDVMQEKYIRNNNNFNKK